MRQLADDLYLLRGFPPNAINVYLAGDVIIDTASRRAGGRIVKQVEGELPSFWFFDAQLVRLALDSAIFNALRYAHARIVLGCRLHADGMLGFYVSDDGPGVQQQPSPSSTGLGLAVCEQVARAHRNRGRHGHSSLDNNDNGGAIFELKLP